MATLLLLGSDLLAVTLAVWVSFEARGALAGDNTIPRLAIVLLPIWVGAAALSGLYPGWGISEPDYYSRVFRTVATSFLLATSVLYFAAVGQGWARVALLLSSLLAIVLVPIARWLCREALLRVGWWGLPVVVLGAGKTGALLVESLRKSPHFGMHPVAIRDDDPSKRGLVIHGVRVDEPISGSPFLPDQAVFVAMPGLQKERMLDLLRGPLARVKHVLLVPDLFGLSASWVQTRDASGVLALEVQRHLLRPEAQYTKRVLDLVSSLVGGLVVLPIFLLIALAIKLDSPGPTFYRQNRLGRNGQRLRVWKFRTMHRDADAALEQYLRENPSLREEWDRDHKLRDDPRITRVGRWLRRTSLDELPQIINVIAGEMSLVGPRPIVAAEVEKYGEDYSVYTQVLPGMTGLWQASGRNDVEYEERVKLDVYYIRNWSVWLDLVILLNTPRAVLSSDGAY